MKNILVLRAKFLALSICFTALGTVSANADSSGVIRYQLIIGLAN